MQSIPTARASHRKRSQTPVSPMSRNNNVTMSSRSQSRSTGHQSTSAIVSKISRGRTTQELKHDHTHSLYVIRCGYGSQCKSIRAGVMRSMRFKAKIKRAAEFNTDYSCWTRDQGKCTRTLFMCTIWCCFCVQWQLAGVLLLLHVDVLCLYQKFSNVCPSEPNLE